MYVANLARIGAWVELSRLQAYNRTGATLNKGDVVAVDILASSTEATKVAEGGETSGFANVISMATANIGRILVVCDDDAVEDNGLGNFVIHGVVEVEVNGDTGLDAGEKLVGTDGQTYLSEWASGGNVVGLLLEDAEASATTKLAIFDGMAWRSEDT
ncbi:MAG TPA: hypothetical protein VJ925_14190 [Longimicrobiales bacterium]|nr:hypothetical protein [Longimicrobiales bacterium]